MLEQVCIRWSKAQAALEQPAIYVWNFVLLLINNR